jgi:hypothetical protein
VSEYVWEPEEEPKEWWRRTKRKRRAYQIKGAGEEIIEAHREAGLTFGNRAQARLIARQEKKRGKGWTRRK